MPPKKDSQQLQTIILTQKGEIKSIKISPTQDISLEGIKKLIKTKQEVDLIANYAYNNQYIHIYGAIDGKEGTDNKHELAPPHDAIIVFGDLIVLVFSNKDATDIVSFTSTQYEKFNQDIFEGYNDEDEDIVENEENDLVADDVDDAVEEIVEEDEDEEEDDEEEEEEEVQEDDEEVCIKTKVIKAKAIKKPKKKIVSVATQQFLQTGRGRQQILLQKDGFKELDHNSLEDSIKKHRSIVIKIITGIITSSNTTSNTTTHNNTINETLHTLKSVDIEKAIFRASCKESEEKHVVCHWDNPLFIVIYSTLSRRLLSNLSNLSYIGNTRLIQRLKDNEFTFDEFASKNSYELFPENWKELSDRQLMREQKLLEGNRGMATDQFKCHGCGKRESTYYQMQIRSSDEPMTTFITCLNCGKRWRQ